MKYMGSKSRIAKYIVPVIQEQIDKNNITRYIEPFVGGANVIDKVTCNERYGFDINKYLIALLQRVQSGGTLYTEVTKDTYDKARSAFRSGNTSAYQDWELGCIGFLASYNGRWFDGGYARPGYEKTKTGERYRDYYSEAKNNLLVQSRYLSDIKFKVMDYRELNPNGCLVYCDPPYAGTKQFANARDFDYTEFWETMRHWSENNIVLISELNAPDDFECIWSQEISRSIKASDKSRAVEKLFTLKQHINRKGLKIWIQKQG